MLKSVPVPAKLLSLSVGTPIPVAHPAAVLLRVLSQRAFRPSAHSAAVVVSRYAARWALPAGQPLQPGPVEWSRRLRQLLLV
eukprot:108613-Chlamydomonas_euryale.AAC.12